MWFQWIHVTGQKFSRKAQTQTILSVVCAIPWLSL